MLLAFSLNMCWQIGSWRLRAEWGFWSSRYPGHDALSLLWCISFFYYFSPPPRSPFPLLLPLFPPSLRVGTICYCFLNLSQNQAHNQCPMDTFERINDWKKIYPENICSFSTVVMSYYEYFVYKMSSCQVSEEKIDSWNDVIICVKENENKSNIESYFTTLFHSHR